MSLMLAPAVEMSLQNSARLPGRSEMVTQSFIKRPSATNALSTTRPKILVSMFPPQSGITTFLPFSSGSRPCRTHARPVAPAPSTTARSSSSNLSMAIAMKDSETATAFHKHEFLNGIEFCIY
jgi:hypothetical protein